MENVLPEGFHRPICRHCIWGHGQQRVKDKKEGQCQQRSGCHTSITMTAARAQRATERDEGTLIWIQTHSQGFASHTQNGGLCSS